VQSPLAWGTEARLAELFAGHAVSARTRQFVFRYRSAEHWLDTFRRYYGPMLTAFSAVDEARTAPEGPRAPTAPTCSTLGLRRAIRWGG
jgi:hypothetical protein